MIIVFTTAPDAEEAETLARRIVETRLAACVQVLPAMKSFYFWEDAVRADDEHLLLVKTTAGKFDALKTFIETHHSYSVPEIVAVEAAGVSGDYLKWLTDYLRTP